MNADERSSTEINEEINEIVDGLVGEGLNGTLSGTVISLQTVQDYHGLRGRFTCGKRTFLVRLASVPELAECTMYVQGSQVSLTAFLAQDMTQLGVGAWVWIMGEPSEFPEDREIHEALHGVAQLKRDAEAARERELSAAFERFATADDGTWARVSLPSMHGRFELELTRLEFMEIPEVRQDDWWVFVDNLLVSPDEFADIEWGAATILVMMPMVGGF